MTIIPLKPVFSNFRHFVLYFPSYLDDAAWLGSSVSGVLKNNINCQAPGLRHMYNIYMMQIGIQCMSTGLVIFVCGLQTWGFVCNMQGRLTVATPQYLRMFASAEKSMGH